MSRHPDIRDTVFPVTREGSQEDEDGYIQALCPNDPGVYVDVGAAHAIECSNTWRLYQRGWRGLLVEPNPKCWYGLLRDRPGDMLCPYAASDTNGAATLRLLATVSSIMPDWPINETGRLIVETRTLAHILDLYPDIRDKCQVCSIDAEGHEGHILQGINWTTFKPKLFVVEYRAYNPDAYGEDISGPWTGILESNGYTKWHQTGINQIWKRK